MNGKQARKLRQQALTQAVEAGLPYTQYGFKQFKKAYTKITGELGFYQVYTAYLEDCQKKLYKQLKREFKQSV